MIDFSRWIYSEDIAKWLAVRKGISTKDQIRRLYQDYGRID